MDECIKIENLTHTYMPGSPFEKVSVDDISMSVCRGEILGLVGHTGSGKSTLIQHFNGLLKPTSGKVFVNGRDISEDKRRLREVRFTVGMVFQYAEYQLFEETVYKDIAFGPKNKGLSDEEVDKRVREAFDAVELDPELLQKSPFDLSGGQKRRVAIAGVIAMEPEVLVLDEPTAGLDPKGRERILRMLKVLNRDMGMTIVIVSHSMEDVARYTDRMIILNRGKVAYSGKPRDVFQHKAELENIGLAVPQASSVVQSLFSQGYDVDRFACTVDEATSTIAALLKGGA